MHKGQGMIGQIQREVGAQGYYFMEYILIKKVCINKQYVKDFPAFFLVQAIKSLMAMNGKIHTLNLVRN